jgi:hypothetical protein
MPGKITLMGGALRHPQDATSGSALDPDLARREDARSGTEEGPGLVFKGAAIGD